MERLDRKFNISAIHPVKGTKHDENDSVLFLAKDDLFLPTLRHYRNLCEADVNVETDQVKGVDLLIERVEQWRKENADQCKAPDIYRGGEHEAVLAPNETEGNIPDEVFDPEGAAGDVSEETEDKQGMVQDDVAVGASEGSEETQEGFEDVQESADKAQEAQGDAKDVQENKDGSGLPF